MRVLITGASGGIGKEVIKQLILLKECEIIAVSRSGELLDDLKEECLEINNNKINTFECDFNETGFQNLISEHIKKKFGSLDCLINNAGTLINKPFMDLNRGDIQKQMQINFECPLLLTQSLIPLLRKSKETAHVLNIGSMGGFQGSEKFKGLSVYSASKGALAILSECLAREFANEDIKFNCLALGSADTEMLRKAFPDYKSPMPAQQMAELIVDFSMKGHRFFNGKVIPVAALST